MISLINLRLLHLRLCLDLNLCFLFCIKHHEVLFTVMPINSMSLWHKVANLARQISFDAFVSPVNLKILQGHARLGAQWAGVGHSFALRLMWSWVHKLSRTGKALELNLSNSVCHKKVGFGRWRVSCIAVWTCFVLLNPYINAWPAVQMITLAAFHHIGCHNFFANWAGEDFIKRLFCSLGWHQVNILHAVFD